MSVTFQRAAYATGVLLDINAFHRYAKNSALPSCTQVLQFRTTFHRWAVGFHVRHTRPPTHALRPVNPNNASHLCITAAAGTELAVASSFGTITPCALSAHGRFSQMTGVYNPKAFILHAASHCHAFAHCKSSTAASRRSLGSVSVPVWLTILSDQLAVSLGEPLPHQQADGTRAPQQAAGPEGSPPLIRVPCDTRPHPVLARLSAGYPQLGGRLPTRYSPFRHSHPHALFRRIEHAESRSTCMPNPRCQRSF